MGKKGKFEGLPVAMKRKLIASLGGSVSSEAKISAARLNGQKGGRPKKASTPLKVNHMPPKPADHKVDLGVVIKFDGQVAAFDAFKDIHQLRQFFLNNQADMDADIHQEIQSMGLDEKASLREYARRHLIVFGKPFGS